MYLDHPDSLKSKTLNLYNQVGANFFMIPFQQQKNFRYQQQSIASFQKSDSVSRGKPQSLILGTRDEAVPEWRVIPNLEGNFETLSYALHSSVGQIKVYPGSPGGLF